MVLRPRWSQPLPRAVQHLVGARAEDADRVALDVLGVVEVELPAAGAGELGQHLAVHHGVGVTLVGHRGVGPAMSSGKSAGQARSDTETIGSGNADASSSRADDRAPEAPTRARSATNAASASSSSGVPERWSQVWPHRRDESVPSAARPRSVPSAAGPRPRSRPRR